MNVRAKEKVHHIVVKILVAKVKIVVMVVNCLLEKDLMTDYEFMKSLMFQN